MAQDFSAGFFTPQRMQLGEQMATSRQARQMAQEQWDWQKKMYKDQQKAAAQGASSLTALVNQYNQAYAAAKAANEQRYNEMLGIADRTTGQRMADVRSAYGERQADAMQQLARLGMGNTTVAPTMQMGIQREQESALNRVADELQGTRLGIMERRTDEYPENNVILALAQALGQGGGAAGLSGLLSALGGMTLGGGSPATPIGSNPPGITASLKNLA